MIMKHLLIGFLVFSGLFISQPAYSACELWEMTIIKSPCNNGKFSVKINFKYKETSDNFTVSGNGKNYGTFLYAKLPIVIDGLPGDCITDYEFVVKDAHNELCNVGLGLGKVCCTVPGCKISELQLDKTLCDSNKMFYTFLNFKAENTSKCFKLKINDHLYKEYEYSALPVKIGPLEGDCTTARVYTVIDCENPDCKAQITQEKVCCENECKLSNLRIEKSDCDSNNHFYAYLNFTAKNVSDSFIIKVNDRQLAKFKYGTNAYKVGPLPGDCVTKFKFLIYDHKNVHCAIDSLWGPVCCQNPPEPCQLSELVVEKSDCNADNQFYLHINFKSKNTSDCFNVFVAGRFSGSYPYNSLPVKLGPFHGDCITNYTLLIKDCKESSCALDKNIGIVCCTPLPDPCKLTELNLTKSDCDADNQFYVTVKFTNKNTSDCFKAYVNTHLIGEFPYSSLPLKLGPFLGDCTTDYKFIFKDCKESSCAIDGSIGKVCCGTPPEPCKLGELEVTKTDCDADDQFYLSFNFLAKNTSECFKLFSNGNLIGEFKYADLPVKVGPFHGDCKTNYSFLIKDCLNADCKLEYNLGKVCCEPGTEPCKLSNLQIERSECDSDHQFYLHLKFSYANASECFKVYINGHEYGEFKYSTLPLKIGPFKGDCTTNYSLAIVDCIDKHCALEKNIGIVCCDGQCKLDDLLVEKTDCLGDKQFYVFLKFKYSGVSECFRVKGNGHDYGEFRYSQLPVKLGPFTADCNTEYEFLIIDCKKPDCKISYNLGKVCCNNSNSKIYEVEMGRTDCDADSNFKLKFNFKYRDVSDSFNININGRHSGTFAYTQLPVSTPNLKADCHTIYKIVLIDQKDTSIHIERYIERPCCKHDIKECKIYDLKAHPLHCTGPDEYALKLNFNYQGITNRHFDVFDRNGNIGFFTYSQLPLTINNFKKSGREFDYVKVCENDNPNCCASIEFMTIDCLTKDPDKFKVSDMVVFTNTTANTVSLYSALEIPDNIDIEMFNLEGKEQDVELIDKQPHEIFISTQALSTNMYFLRIKNNEDIKTFKFFHIK